MPDDRVARRPWLQAPRAFRADKRSGPGGAASAGALRIAMSVIFPRVPCLLRIDTMTRRYRDRAPADASTVGNVQKSGYTHGNPGDSLLPRAGRHAQFHARGGALQRLATGPHPGHPAPRGQARRAAPAPRARQHASHRARPHHAAPLPAGRAADGGGAQAREVLRQARQDAPHRGPHVHHRSASAGRAVLEFPRRPPGRRDLHEGCAGKPPGRASDQGRDRRRLVLPPGGAGRPLPHAAALSRALRGGGGAGPSRSSGSTPSASRTCTSRTTSRAPTASTTTTCAPSGRRSAASI